MSILDPVTLTVKRRSGTWTDGHWVPGAQVESTITVSRPQPVGPETLDMLPEQARSDAKFEIWAEDDQAELHLIERDEDVPADVVVYGGESYLVTGVEDLSDVPLGHRVYVLLAYAPDEEIAT